MGLFNREKIENKTQVPVWFMRQAGRYHNHYQNLKKEHSFMELCKDPKLACEVTMGPIREFNFDAAILFSDLLFPLEYLGLGLEYNPGPILTKHLKTSDDVLKLNKLGEAQDFFNFQKEACLLLKKSLPQNKDLIGFVGAPFTLFAYATEGSHSGGLIDAKKAFYNGTYSHFNELLLPAILNEMKIQAQGQIDAIALFDTAVGELPLSDFKIVAQDIMYLVREFKKEFPHIKVIYYSRNTHLHYLEELRNSKIDVLGVDWRVDLSAALKQFGDEFMIQGNIEPTYLLKPWNELENHWLEMFNTLEKNKVNFSRWICGLGHGVLQWTPQENVKKSVELIHKTFRY
jgi:uroporphyrinogen decarboxylase